MIPTPRPPRTRPEPGKALVRFRLTYLRRRGKWSCAKAAPKFRVIAIRKLREYERLTVMQFRQGSGPRLKRLHGKEFPPPPPELSEDIQDNLALEFRLGGKARAMGYLRDDTFYVIWLDPEHRITG